MMTLMVSVGAGCGGEKTAAESQTQAAQASQQAETGENADQAGTEEKEEHPNAIKPEIDHGGAESDTEETEEENGAGETEEENDAAETETEMENGGGETQTGNSTGETQTASADGELSDDWTDMQFMLDGNLYELPVSYRELEADGWKFDLAAYGYTDGYIMNPGDKTYSTIELTNPDYDEDLTVWVGFINTGDKAQDILDCEIWAFQMDTCVGSRQLENYPDMEIAGGIGFGSTREEVEAAFGECEDVYEADSGYNYVVCNYEMDYDYYLKLTIYEDKGVTAIDISTYE